MEKNTASFDVYFPSLGIKPWRVFWRAEHNGKTAVEFYHKFNIDRLKPDSTIVSLTIERAISELYADHIGKLGRRIG